MADLFGDNYSPPPIQSLGGVARAKKLSPDERKQIAAKAAAARWGNTPSAQDSGARKAVAQGDLKLGELIIPCAVLEDGTRVVSERGLGKTFGRVRGGQDWVGRAASEEGTNLPYFISQRTLKPYIQGDPALASYERLIYQPLHGGRLAYGTKAELIPNICDVWLKARDTITLNDGQRNIAAKADAIMRGLAHVGITALIDEATGYQYVRDKSELQKILSAYISEELLPWANRFPREFFKEMFRLWGWEWPASDGGGPRGPRYAGKLIKQLIYEKLPPGILNEIETRNPPDENWQRRDRNHQWLTNEIGQPHLDKQVAVVTTLMRISATKYDFLQMYNKAFPPPSDQAELFEP